jgi:hypothetical protein
MSSGPDTSSAGSTGPGRIVRLLRAPFEGVVIGGLILIPLFIAIAWVRGQS